MEEILKELVSVQKGMLKELSSLNKSIQKLEKQYTPQEEFYYKGNLYQLALINSDNLKKITDILDRIRRK